VNEQGRVEEPGGGEGKFGYSNLNAQTKS